MVSVCMQSKREKKCNRFTVESNQYIKNKPYVCVNSSIFLPICSFTADKEENHSAADDLEQFGGVIFL